MCARGARLPAPFIIAPFDRVELERCQLEARALYVRLSKELGWEGALS